MYSSKSVGQRIEKKCFEEKKSRVKFMKIAFFCVLAAAKMWSVTRFSAQFILVWIFSFYQKIF